MPWNHAVLVLTQIPRPPSYIYHYFYHSSHRYHPDFSFQLLCLPIYVPYVVYFYKQHYRRKTSQVALYKCLTGYKRKSIFIAHFRIFAYMQIKKYYEPAKSICRSACIFAIFIRWTELEQIWRDGFPEPAHVILTLPQNTLNLVTSITDPIFPCSRLRFLPLAFFFTYWFPHFAGSSTKAFDAHQPSGTRRHLFS